MSTSEIRAHCVLDEQCRSQLKSADNEMGLSARAHDKVLRVSRTIADLDNEASIRVEHLQEAINYRILDRQFWS